MKTLFLPSHLDNKLNYNFIIALYLIAEYDKDNKLYSVIKYSNIQALTDKINSISICGNSYIASSSSVYRFINSNQYNAFFSIDKNNKSIRLNNNFKASNINNIAFIKLYLEEAQFLLHQNDKLLTIYFLL
jgi:hypothetical protein